MGIPCGFFFCLCFHFKSMACDCFFFPGTLRGLIPVLSTEGDRPMNNLKTLTAAIAFATFGIGAPAVMAQAEGAPQQYEQGQPAATPISDDNLKKFVEADKEVAELRDEFSEKLSKAEDQEEAQKLQLEAQEKMVEAVQDADLDVATYNEIATRMQTDPELQQRAESHR